MSVSVLNADLDVETLRNFYESDTEWTLRKTFLSAHKDKFPLARLHSLSCGLINTELYGNYYSDDLMKELSDLICDLPAVCKHLLKEKQEEKKFLTTKEALSSECNSDGASDLSGPLSFVKGSSEAQRTDEAIYHPEHEIDRPLYHTHEFIEQLSFHSIGVNEEYDNLIFKLAQEFNRMNYTKLDFVGKLNCAAKHLKSRLEFKHHAGQTVKYGLTYFTSELRINSILLSTGAGLSKKSSKFDTYTKSLEKICSQCVHVELEPGKFGIGNSPVSFFDRGEKCIDFANMSSKRTKRKLSSLTAPKCEKQVKVRFKLSDFGIVEPLVHTHWKSFRILRESSKCNNKSLKFELERVGSEFKCDIFLDGHLLESCEGPTRKSFANVGAKPETVDQFTKHDAELSSANDLTESVDYFNTAQQDIVCGNPS